jgi:hypothetical protein
VAVEAALRAAGLVGGKFEVWSRGMAEEFWAKMSREGGMGFG